MQKKPPARASLQQCRLPCLVASRDQELSIRMDLCRISAGCCPPPEQPIEKPVSLRAAPEVSSIWRASTSGEQGTVFLQDQAHPPWKSQSRSILHLGKGWFHAPEESEGARWLSQHRRAAASGLVVIARDAFLCGA